MWRTDVMVQGIRATARATPGAGGPRRRARGEGAGTGPGEAVSPATETRSLRGDTGDKKSRGQRGKWSGEQRQWELGVQGVLDGRTSKVTRAKAGWTQGVPASSGSCHCSPKGTEDLGTAPISRSHQRNNTVTEEGKKEEMQ